MIRSALAYLFHLTEPEPRKYLAVALIVLGVCLKLWLSARTRRRWFSVYMVCASAASLLQRSPLWSLWAEIGLTAVTGLFVWEGIARVKWWEHRWFGVFVGGILFAALLVIDPKPYPMFSESRYYLMLFSSAFFFAAAIGAEFSVWSDGLVVRAHNLLVASWFLMRMLATMKWNDYFPGFDVWWVIVTSSAAQIVCLLIWLLRAERTSARYSPSDSEDRGYRASGVRH